ncbi:MAG: DUF1549 domain-containing protein [Planctomycetaceae bacterium]|nr:DUF1549 domain-containing protein [Planctomycetaceae bacterium]
MPLNSSAFRILLLSVLMVSSAGKVPAESPPQAKSLTVIPAQVHLTGKRAVQQLAVTAEAGQVTMRDVTSDAEFAVADPSVATIRDGIVRPLADGRTVLSIRWGNSTTEVPISVQNSVQPAPVMFHSEVLAALTKAGCNMGACHGSPSGKGGFRLSLRGYDPPLDVLTLRGEFFGRRANLLSPEESLLLRKPLMETAHGGGKRLERGSDIYNVLRDWIAEGMQTEDNNAPKLERIEVLPGDLVFHDVGDRQQLIVNGHFRDGIVRDVTALTAFDSSDDNTATISASGVVRREGRGEVTILARVLDRMDTSRLTFLTERPGFQWTNPETFNDIDRLVFRKLQQLQIAPADLCSDSDFQRRVTLDLTGRLPTLDEVQAFRSDSAEDKRTKLIDRLLSSPDYASFWSLKWGDVLRCNSRRLTEPGAHKFRRWLFDVVRSDMPLNQFATELLTASGSTQLNPAANYWRASRDEIDATETTAQLFLGIRMQCAKCHNHPFEKWTQDDYYGVAAAFYRVGRKEDRLPGHEIVFVKHSGDVRQPRTGETMKVRLLLRGDVDVPDNQDRRAVFARWLTAADNPFFAKSLANRIWGHLTGRGIVEPVDDFRDSNPPSNPELLNLLAAELAGSNYSARHLIRFILTSRTYQLSAQTNDNNSDDELYFSHAVTRMLTAEQLLDGICQLTGVPEKFSGLPAGTRAVDLADPPEGHKFLQVFGQPQRELPCECERSTDSNLSQALQLINGSVVQNKLRDDSGNLHRWVREGRSDREIVDLLYQTGLSRRPNPDELNVALKHVSAVSDRLPALEDIAWAVINSREFLFRH